MRKLKAFFPLPHNLHGTPTPNQTSGERSGNTPTKEPYENVKPFKPNKTAPAISSKEKNLPNEHGS